MRFLIPILALLLFVDAAAARQQVVLGPVLDNSMFQESGSESNGKGAYLFAGTTRTGSVRRGLIAFDLTGVPVGATVTGAALTLNMSKSNVGGVLVNLHRVLAVWGEGTSDAAAEEGKGAAATASDATWTQRMFGSANWTTPGGDFEPTASAQLSVAGEGKYTWSSPGLVADVQAWLNGSATNAGWIVIGGEGVNQTAKRFDSRENPTASLRPVLTITYSVGTAVEKGPLPEAASLAQNYPNPFRSSTSFVYSVPRESRVDLSIFDLLGRAVAVLAAGRSEGGRHEAILDGSDLPPGIYIARLKVGDQVITRQLVRMP